MADTTKYVSKIYLDGAAYDIKDAESRSLLDTLTTQYNRINEEVTEQGDSILSINEQLSKQFPRYINILRFTGKTAENVTLTDVLDAAVYGGVYFPADGKYTLSGTANFRQSLYMAGDTDTELDISGVNLQLQSLYCYGFYITTTGYAIYSNVSKYTNCNINTARAISIINGGFSDCTITSSADAVEFTGGSNFYIDNCRITSNIGVTFGYMTAPNIQITNNTFYLTGSDCKLFSGDVSNPVGFRFTDCTVDIQVGEKQSYTTSAINAGDNNNAFIERCKFRTPNSNRFTQWINGSGLHITDCDFQYQGGESGNTIAVVENRGGLIENCNFTPSVNTGFTPPLTIIYGASYVRNCSFTGGAREVILHDGGSVLVLERNDFNMSNMTGDAPCAIKYRASVTGLNVHNCRFNMPAGSRALILSDGIDKYESYDPCIFHGNNVISYGTVPIYLPDGKCPLAMMGCTFLDSSNGQIFAYGTTPTTNYVTLTGSVLRNANADNIPSSNKSGVVSLPL